MNFLFLSSVVFAVVSLPKGSQAFFTSTSYSWETVLPSEGLADEQAKYYSSFQAVRIISLDSDLTANGYVLSESQYDFRKSKLGIRFDTTVGGVATKACFVLDLPDINLEEAVGEAENRNASTEVETGEPKNVYVEAGNKLSWSTLITNGYLMTSFCWRSLGKGNVYSATNSTSSAVTTSYKVSGLVDPLQPELSVPYIINLTGGLTLGV